MSKYQGKGPLHDHRVRLALHHAINRRALAEVLGREDLLEAYDPFGYDPALARRLIEEAGYGDDIALSVKTAHREFPGAAALAAQLAEVGVRLRIDEVAWPTWLDLARRGADDGTTLYHAGSGVFVSRIANALEDEIQVEAYCRDLAVLCAAAYPSDLLRAVIIGQAAPPIFAQQRPLTPQEIEHRRMRVWMWDEPVVALFAWWPALTTASRINYRNTIADLISNTLDATVDDGACLEELEILSHGGSDANGNHEIRMGHDRLSMADFDPATNEFRPNTPSRRLVDALRRAMCPNGRLKFSACFQGGNPPRNGDLLRAVSRHLGNAIRVSGYSGIGVPDGVPLVDVMPPDLHFMNGSAASAPP